MHTLTVFLLATILALAPMPAPQSQKKSPPEEKTECGTVITPEQLEFESASKDIAPLAMAPSTDTPLYLPLTIHIVHRSDGTGGFTLDQLAIAMQDLNRMWELVGIRFFIYGEIDHINDDAHFNVPNVQANRDALRQVNPVANTINVYFTNLAGLCGQSTFTNDSDQGVLMDIGCAGNAANPSTFAHEIGHYFDLYHTHEDVFGVECPSGNNCSSAGDRLCDTPADPGLIDHTTNPPTSRVNASCVYDNSAATPANCDTTPYDPPTRNLMSYSRAACRSEFTPNQISKVLQRLHNAGNRKNLINSGKFYVDPQASNFNTQCTPSAPCRTVAKAVSAAQNGAFIFLKPGVHPTSSVGGKNLTLMRWGNSGVAELRP